MPRRLRPLGSLGWAVLLAFGLISPWQGVGQEPEIDRSQMPRIPAVEPEDALGTFEIRPGFQLVMVAHEPDVVDPIAMAFDADGGMYVIEMRGYSERREDRLGRIRYLRDADGDGVFETSTIFKDGLKWPTGIVCYKGGVFVGATPDLSYYKDTDGDGVCDEERLVFTGFGPESGRLNMQALFNSFCWGPDNRIWGATASSGGIVRRPDDPDFPAVSIRGSDFSFDPEKLDFRAENGTAQYGMTFDSQGRRFVSQNSRHVIWVAYERGQVRPNPFYALPEPLVDIPADGAAAPVFRISDDEPWRVVRTRWRVSGVVRGMVEGGGRVSGYFTSASGVHAYWGSAYGENFHDNVFIGDVGSNLVHRKLIESPMGQVQPIARRPDDERETEFLRSSDNWFRPASFATGPDGCLYICDMYRETIEHPWSLPPGIKQHLDLNSGNDRGRVYRVEPVGFQRAEIPNLSVATDGELRELALQSGDQWAQTTARRLLFERGKPLTPQPPSSPFPAALDSSVSLLDKLSAWRGDPWLEAVILNSLRTEQSIREALAEVDVRSPRAFEVEVFKIVGHSGRQRLWRRAAEKLVEGEVSDGLFQLVSGLKEGILRAGGDWDEVKDSQRLEPVFRRSIAVSLDEKAAEETRLAALRLNELAGSAADDAARLDLIRSPTAAPALKRAAAEGMVDPSLLLEEANRLSPEVIRLAGDRMSESSGDALRLLQAIEAGRMGAAALSAQAMQSLRRHEDAQVAALALKVLPQVKTRLQVVSDYERALDLPGDPERGQTVFARNCQVCHQTPEGLGQAFGPPVATFKNAGKPSLLGNILDPNKEVAPQYQAFQFELKNGEAFTGMIASENERRVTVALPGGVEKSFPRREVKSMSGVGRSLMPEGMENLIPVEEMADLLAYLAD